MNHSHAPISVTHIHGASLRRIFTASLMSSLITGAALIPTGASTRMVVTAVVISFLASIALHMMGTER